MTEFDYFKAFVGIDLLTVSAIGEVIGRMEAAIFKGMIDGGLSETNARRIIHAAHTELFRAALKAGPHD
jgi:hypothetical protein